MNQFSLSIGADSPMPWSASSDAFKAASMSFKAARKRVQPIHLNTQYR